MERDPNDLLVPGMFAQADKPPLRIHAIERELHAVSSAAARMANALERIAPALETTSRNLAALRELVERSSR